MFEFFYYRYTFVYFQDSSIDMLIERNKRTRLTRNRSGTSIEPWGTPAITALHVDVCTFKITLWNLCER